MKRHEGMCLCLAVWCGSLAAAAGGEVPLTVRAAVGEALEIVVEAGVGDLVRCGDPATLKVEHTSGHVFITPMSDRPADLTVIDQGGRSRRLKFVFDGPADRKIILPAEAPADDSGARQDEGMAFMRRLIRRENPSGSSARAEDRVMYDDGRIRLRSLTAHETLRLAGYDITAENLTAEPLPVPLQRIMVPGLLAVWSEKDILAPGEKGRMHMVVRR
jgi:hypothetical protein